MHRAFAPGNLLRYTLQLSIGYLKTPYMFYDAKDEYSFIIVLDFLYFLEYHESSHCLRQN